MDIANVDDEGNITEHISRIDIRETPGDLSVPATGVSVCLKRWWNAGPDARKKMFQVFDASGIFAGFCRHGFLMAICDMVRSGERYAHLLSILTD